MLTDRRGLQMLALGGFAVLLAAGCGASSGDGAVGGSPGRATGGAGGSEGGSGGNVVTSGGSSDASGGRATPSTGGASLGTIVEVGGDLGKAKITIWDALELRRVLFEDDVERVSDFPNRIATATGEATWGGAELARRSIESVSEPPAVPEPHSTTQCARGSCTFAGYLQKYIYGDIVDGSVRLTSDGTTETLSVDLGFREAASNSTPAGTIVSGTLEYADASLNGKLVKWEKDAGSYAEVYRVTFENVTYSGYPGGAGMLVPESGSVHAERFSRREGQPLEIKSATFAFP